MTVRKILGSIHLKHGNHSIGKLSNGLYSVGNLYQGKCIPPEQHFESFNAAFDYWSQELAHIPNDAFQPV